MSLPAVWVDQIFEQLTLRYGHDFLRRWEGMNMAAVKADWARTLGGLDANPDALLYGLEHLPEREAPTAGQFRALCNTALREERQQALPMPKPKPDQARNAAQQLRRIGRGPANPLQWAIDLQAQEKAGRPLTEAQRSAWREALQERTAVQEAVSVASIIPRHALPPQMQADLEAMERPA
ncbi:hypothetical protein [Aquincola tertiaricarbonis]|uniref:hypothetical protein n=1 Tax=Aquincola tertiaricarbonis TaxID=391953 RepID=UPI0006965E51|nr:hypothetical protein [Aquincola tertiaricarbonis]